MMECDNILKAIEAQNFNRPEEARPIFADSLQNILGLIQESPLGDDPALQREAVRVYCQSFFEYSGQWINQEQKKHKPSANHPDAEKLKDQALYIQGQLEEIFISYILTLMEIYRSLSIIRQNRVKYKRTLAIDKKSKAIEWSSGTSKMLIDAILSKKALDTSTRRLALAQFHLDGFVKNNGDVLEKITELYGSKNADTVLRPIRSKLRRGEFDVAKQAVEKLKAPKKMLSFRSSQSQPALEELQALFMDYIDLLQKHKQTLVVEEGRPNLFLTTSEIRINLVAQVKELDQKERYMRKYFGPYLNYVQKSFKHLQDKLQIIGSIESLLTLYLSLIKGVAEPLAEIVEVREFESKVINKVDYLISSQNKEIENIRHINDEDFRVFEQYMTAFEEVLRS